MATNTNAELVRQDLGPTLLAVAWTSASIACLVIIARLYVRLGILRIFHIDDGFILITFALALVKTILCTVSVHWGLGRHIQALSAEQISHAIKYVFICEFFSIMAPCLGRISYALLLLQLLPHEVGARRLLWAVIYTTFIVDLSTVIICFSQCQPMHEFWGPNPEAHCWDVKVAAYSRYFQGSLASAIDLLLALFPASLFWNMNMKVSTKISLSGLMGLGVFAMVCSVNRTITSRIIDDGDPTYAICKVVIWWALEVYAVLIAASMPTIRPLLRTTTSSIRHSASKIPTGQVVCHARLQRISSVGASDAHPAILNNTPAKEISGGKRSGSIGHGDIESCTRAVYDRN